MCGRGAWPSMLGKGQLGAHRLETLFCKGRQVGGRVLWVKTDRSEDVDWLLSWVAMLQSLLQILRDRLEALGEETEDREEVGQVLETVHTQVVAATKRLGRTRELSTALPLVRGARLHRTAGIVVPKIVGA